MDPAQSERGRTILALVSRLARENSSWGYRRIRPHRALHSAAPLHPLLDPITDTNPLDHVDIHRRDRLGELLHEYAHAA